MQNRRFPRPGIRVPSSTSSRYRVIALSRHRVIALSRYRVTRTRRVTCVRACVRACVRRRARARQINRAGPVRGSRNQAEAKAVWADFPPPLLPRARVSRLEDMAMYFLHVFCTRLQPYSQFLEDMEWTCTLYVRVTLTFVTFGESHLESPLFF